MSSICATPAGIHWIAIRRPRSGLSQVPSTRADVPRPFYEWLFERSTIRARGTPTLNCPNTFMDAKWAEHDQYGAAAHNS